MSRAAFGNAVVLGLLLLAALGLGLWQNGDWWQAPPLPRRWTWAGLLLLAVSSWLPADSSTQSAAPAAMTDSTADYAAELETRLTALISRVEGAGKTAVMVTLESGSESIYATDTDSDGSSTHVLLGSGGADGLVETVETPRVLGVAVVCEGGGSAAVQSRVTALVQALTGIGTNHITVAKMASAN